MRGIILAASLALTSGPAAALPDWLVYNPKPRAERTLEDTEQYKRLESALLGIFTADHLAQPFPAVYIVEPNADELKTPDQGIMKRFATVSPYRYGFADRAIYFSELALIEDSASVIRRIEHATVHFHVHEHHRDGAGWHGPVFDSFCAEAGFGESCDRSFCSHSKSEFWPDTFTHTDGGQVYTPAIPE